jgi:dTDP-4-dehydrorhamnose 3,5-epimerase
MHTNQDDRAFRYCDVFPEIGKGDINVSVCHPQTLCAWHRHKKQTDYWFVVKGSLKVGLMEDGKPPTFIVLSDRDPKVISIPPETWHGYFNFTNEQAILMYHITEKYDGTDEERMQPNASDWMRIAK